MPIKVVQEIVGLKVNMASFVSRGANPGAKRMFWKSEQPAWWSKVFRTKPARSFDQVLKDDGMEMPRTTDEVLEERELWNAWWAIRDAFDTACDEIRWSGVENKAAMLLESVQQYAARVAEAFAAFSKQFPAAELFERAWEQHCAEAIQKSEFDFEQFNRVLDAVEHEANAPARSPATGTNKEPEAMKWSDVKNWADFVKFLKGAPKEERDAATKAMQDAGIAPVLDATTEVQRGQPLDPAASEKCVNCSHCGKEVDLEKARKETAYMAGVPESVRLEMKARDEKIAALEKADRDAKLFTLAADIAPGGVEPATVQEHLALYAGNEKVTEQLVKMYRGVKARAESADRILLERAGNRGRAKAGSATAEFLERANKLAEVKKISLAKAMDEITAADPALAERADAEQSGPAVQ